jgi:serine/threonine protein kinase
MAVDATKPVLQTIGNYDLLEKIAEGGMGTVYRGRDRATGQMVAIKVVPATLARNPVLLKRFEQEFRAASILDHPNIVRALDYGTSGSSPYLVMEYVEGESLGQRLDREGKIPEAEAIRIIAQVAQGLHRAHKQGLVHRDVKPDNILVTPEGIAKLADLGLVKEMEADLNLTRTGRGLGTPHFMAPEQFRNAKSADARCDIYSMAATLYQMVTGDLPFKSCGPLDAWMKKIQNELTPPRNVNPALSERIDWAIRRGMSADPEQRPAHCREFVEDLTGHSTRKLPTPEMIPAADIWYLVYKDEEGEVHTVKGAASAVRRSLKEGLLGDASNVRAGRSKAGPFELLRSYPEFRDLVIAPAPLAMPSKSNTPAKTPLPSSLPRPSEPPQTAAVIRPSSSGETLAATSAPHITWDDGSTGRLEWLQWVFLLLIAGGAAVAGFFLFSHR